MKRFNKIFLVIVGFILFPICAHSQVKGIVDYALIDEDNTIIGDTTIITVHVRFISSVTNLDTAVNGNLYYHYQTDSMIAAFGMGNVESLDDSPGWEIVPVGGKFDTIQFPCQPYQLRTGPVNVIIIWPALYNPLTPMVDSGMYVLTNVSVGAQIGILEEGNQSFGSTVFPNPSAGTQIVMINSKYYQPITQICIMNAMGQILTKKVFADDEDSGGYVIPTEELRPGIYHIQINYIDHKSEVVRFIKN